jgi:hypothetical protein
MSKFCSCMCYGYVSTDGVVELQAGRSGDRNLVGAIFFRPRGPPSSCKMGSLSPSSRQSGRSMALIYHPLLPPGAKYGWSYTPRCPRSQLWHVTGVVYFSTAILE